MTFAEFHKAVQKLAVDHYFSVSVEISQGYKREIWWSAFVGGPTPVRVEDVSAEECLRELRSCLTPGCEYEDPALDAIGDPEGVES